VSTRRLEVVISGDAQSLQRALGGVNRDLGGLDKSSSRAGAALKRIAVGAALAGGALVAAFAVKGVQASSDLSEQISKASVVFGAASDSVIAFSKTTASSLGISQRAALEATGTFGNMLVPMGFARAEAAKVSTRFVQLAADMASFNNSTPEEALDALRSGLAGESEPLRKFGVFLSDARLKQEALSLGIYKGKGALDANAKAQATYALILKDTKDTQGDFGRTVGESLPNQLRIARAEFEELQASLGNKLIPVMVSFGGFVKENAATLQKLAGFALAAGVGYAAYTVAVKAAAAASLIATIATQGLTAATAASPIGLFVAAVAAAGVGIALLSQRTSYAEASQRGFSDATRGAASASREAASALDAQKAATDRLTGANIGIKEAQLRFKESTQAVAEAERTYGKRSDEATRAQLELRRAVLGLSSAKREQRDATKGATDAARETTAATTKEVDQAQRAVNIARERVNVTRQLGGSTKDLVPLEKALASAQKNLADKSGDAALRLLASARASDSAAKAAGGATPEARALRDELNRLSKASINAALATALGNIGAAASSAADGVQSLYNKLLNPPAAPRFNLSGVPTGGGGRPGQESQERRRLPSNPSFGLRGAPVGSPTDLARTTSAGDRRGRSARIDAETRARKPGVSDEDVSQEGERAFIAARKTTVNTLRRKINARRKALIVKLKRFDISARMKVRVPGPKWVNQRQAALDRRAAMKATADGIREELEGLAVDYRDLALELRDLGEQVSALDRTDEAEAASAAAVPTDAPEAAAAAPTAGDYLDAAAAEAALTPDLGDDLAAALAIEGQANAELASARASGDPRRIADAARAALSARQSREQIEATMANTNALNANTDAVKQSFGGSVTFGFRGQDYVLGSLAPPSSDRLTGAEVGI